MRAGGGAGGAHMEATVVGPRGPCGGNIIKDKVVRGRKREICQAAVREGEGAEQPRPVLLGFFVKKKKIHSNFIKQNRVKQILHYGLPHQFPKEFVRIYFGFFLDNENLF